MNMTHTLMSTEIVSTEISCNGPLRPSPISVSFLNRNQTALKISISVSAFKLQLNCVETETSKN